MLRARGGCQVSVGGNVDLKGGVIASTAEKEDNRLSAESLTYSDIANHSKSETSNIGLSAGLAMKAEDKKLQLVAPDAPLGGLAVSPVIGQPAKEEDAGAALATLTPGQLELRNQTQDLASLNTDLSKANTQVEGLDIARLKAKQASAAALSELLNSAVGDLSAHLGFQEGSAEKIALHAAVGAIVAKTAGGDMGTGALSAALQEAIGAAVAKALMSNPNVTQAQRDALAKWASVLVGSLSGGETGAAIALDAEAFNRQLHIAETELIKSNAARYAVEQGYCKSTGTCDPYYLDIAIAELTAQAVKQTDITGANIARNDAAAAFLAAISPKGSIPAICNTGSVNCGQTWFSASGDVYQDTAINSDFFSQNAAYYDLASSYYNLSHLTQIAIADSMAKRSQEITVFRNAIGAINGATLPWELFNDLFSGKGGPFAKSQSIAKRLAMQKNTGGDGASLNGPKGVSVLGDLRTNIHLGAQDKHIPGTNNYDPTRSTLTVNPQALLDGVHSGQYPIVREIPRGNTTSYIVDFGSPIGDFKSNGTLVGPTQYGQIVQSKNGVHIIPANPNQF